VWVVEVDVGLECVEFEVGGVLVDITVFHFELPELLLCAFVLGIVDEHLEELLLEGCQMFMLWGRM
jgi:hypothetical protein